MKFEFVAKLRIRGFELLHQLSAPSFFIKNKPINTMQQIILNIPRDPPTLNKLLRMHHFARSREKKIFESIIALQFRPLRPEKPLEKFELEITRFCYKKQDQDNVVGSMKIIIDALRTAKFILDDSPTHMLKVDVIQKIIKRPVKKFILVKITELA